MKNQVTVVGSANADMVIKVPHLPQAGETVLGGEFQLLQGGKGANQAVAAQRAGAEVTFVACVGDDMFGQEACASYRRDGINISNVITVPNTKTGIAQILVDANGRNMIAVSSGANAQLTSEKIQQSASAIQNADVVLVQLETPLASVIATIELAAQHQKTIILNPAPAQKLPDSLFSKLSFITPNETEAELLTGIKIKTGIDARQAAIKLLDKGVKQVLITLGDQGVYYHTAMLSKLLPALTVRPVDSTAAGDTFSGALAAALAQGTSVLNAIQFAQTAAGLSVTKMGAQSSIPYLAEIKAAQTEF